MGRVVTPPSRKIAVREHLRDNRVLGRDDEGSEDEQENQPLATKAIARQSIPAIPARGSGGSQSILVMISAFQTGEKIAQGSR